MIIKFNEIKNIVATEEVMTSINKAKRQLAFGDIVENNILNLMEDCAATNYIKVDRLNKVYDYFFGADSKVMFMHDSKDNINGMSTYIDITVADKEGVKYLSHDARTGRMYLSNTTSPMPVYTLSNGLKLMIGLRTRNGNRFYYKKPVIIVRLLTEGFVNPIFTESDINAIVMYLRRACFFTSYGFRYTFNHVCTIGTGKRASEVISLNNNSYAAAEIAASIED